MGSVALRDALNNARRRLEGVEGHYIPTIADVVESLAQQQDESAAARAELAHVASLIDARFLLGLSDES